MKIDMFLKNKDIHIEKPTKMTRSSVKLHKTMGKSTCTCTNSAWSFLVMFHCVPGLQLWQNVSRHDQLLRIGGNTM